MAGSTHTARMAKTALRIALAGAATLALSPAAQAAIPGAALFALVLAINLLGDGLRDAYNSTVIAVVL